MRYLTRSLYIHIIALFCCTIAHAEEWSLVVQLTNTLNQSIPGLVFSATGDSSTSMATDIAGKTRIKLASQTRPGDEVELVIVKSPEDSVFISSWNNRVSVPSFEKTRRSL